MLKRISLFLVLALLLAAIENSFGQSQQLSPSGSEGVKPPNVQSQKSDSNPAPDQRDNEQMPLVVKVLPTPESPERSAAEAKREDQKAASDERIARFTERLFWATVALSVIAVAQFFAFLWQGWQLKRTVNLARQEFIATHRPKIKIHAVEVTRREVEGRSFIGASILAFNTGESVAKSVEVRGEIFMGPRFAIDVQRPLVKRFDEVLSGQKMRAEITSEWQTVMAATGKRTGIICYCLGWIAYWDENGQRRETGFCLHPEFGADRDRWVSAEKPEHEYSY